MLLGKIMERIKANKEKQQLLQMINPLPMRIYCLVMRIMQTYCFLCRKEA